MCAVIKQGILGGFQNAIGSVVGSSWKGIAVMKSKPLSVANPKTAGQVAQRTKMTNVVAFAQAILATLIKPLWDRFASQMSGYNDFVMTNIHLFALAYPGTPASFILSKGKMAATTIATAVLDISDHTVSITWADDTGQGLKLTGDKPYCLVYNQSLNKFAVAAGLDTRGDGGIDFEMPASTVLGNVVHCWLAFRRTDGTVVSDSSYKIVTVQA
jgi:hypothetical protein